MVRKKKIIAYRNILVEKNDIIKKEIVSWNMSGLANCLFPSCPTHVPQMQQEACHILFCFKMPTHMYIACYLDNISPFV